MVTYGTHFAIESVVILCEPYVPEAERNKSILVHPLVEMFAPMFIPFIGPIALIYPTRLSHIVFQRLSEFLHSKMCLVSFLG